MLAMWHKLLPVEIKLEIQHSVLERFSTGIMHVYDFFLICIVFNLCVHTLHTWTCR